MKYFATFTREQNDNYCYYVQIDVSSAPIEFVKQRVVDSADEFESHVVGVVVDGTAYGCIVCPDGKTLVIRDMNICSRSELIIQLTVLGCLSTDNEFELNDKCLLEEMKKLKDENDQLRSDMAKLKSFKAKVKHLLDGNDLSGRVDDI